MLGLQLGMGKMPAILIWFWKPERTEIGRTITTLAPSTRVCKAFSRKIEDSIGRRPLVLWQRNFLIWLGHLFLENCKKNWESSLLLQALHNHRWCSAYGTFGRMELIHNATWEEGMAKFAHRARSQGWEYSCKDKRIWVPWRKCRISIMNLREKNFH